MACIKKYHLFPVVMLTTLAVLAACGGGSSSEEHQQEPPQKQKGLPIPDNRYVDHYNILLMGNSHVYVNDLGAHIVRLIQAGRPGATATATVANNSLFLDERLQDTDSQNRLSSETWTHVILQGQKYSTSGAFDYPIDASLYWVSAVKHYKATPLLFPEHPRAGNSEEGARVHAIHRAIANQEPSCVAPVGLAFDKMAELAPEIRLHQADGNHTSINGTFLTALVFYHAITGLNADSLPDQTNLAISPEHQQLMRQVASATLAQYPACIF